MSLVVKTAIYPSSISAYENGRIPTGAMRALVPADGHSYLFAPEVADQFEDMILACAQECGVDLVFTPGGAYRTLESQVSLFLQRYSSTFLGGRPVKQWQGRNYWLRYGMAEAAVPGTSNHGRGIAGDIAEWRDDAYISIASSTCWQWVLGNADRFGFSWELQSEPWHLRLVRINPTDEAGSSDPSEQSEEDVAVIFKTAQTGDSVFAQNAAKEVRHVTGFEGFVAEATEPGWAANVKVINVPDDVAQWLNQI